MADSTACSIEGSTNQAGRSPAGFRYGLTTARRMDWRTYSVSSTGLRVEPPASPSASRIETASRIDTRSRNRFCSTRCTVERGSSLGTTSSTTLGCSTATRSILDDLGMLHSHAVQQALGILPRKQFVGVAPNQLGKVRTEHAHAVRSEEHTSELQSPMYL